jgi:hypothetical protein
MTSTDCTFVVAADHLAGSSRCMHSGVYAGFVLAEVMICVMSGVVMVRAYLIIVYASQ